MSNVKLLLVTVFLVVACMLAAQVSTNITLETKVIQALGNTLDIKVVGNLAYISGSEHVLMCFDVSNPTQPLMLSYAYHNDEAIVEPYFGSYGKLLIIGDYAYYYVEGNTVAICDISNHNNIIWLSNTVEIPGFNLRGTVSGDRLYIAGNPQNSITIWDISNPLAPQQLGIYTFSGLALDVQVSGNYAYVANYDSYPIRYNVNILNIGNPANPVFISNFSGGGESILYYNGFLYGMPIASDHFDVFDVSEPLLPVLGSPISIPDYVDGREWLIDSGILYLRCEPWQIEDRDFYPLARYDLSNPAVPVELAPFTCSYAFYGQFDVENNRLFMTDESRNTVIYAPANDSSMLKVGGISRSGNYFAERLNGYLYLNSGNIVSCAQPASPPHYFGYQDTMACDGNSLFSAKNASIYKWDLSQPEMPVQIANAELWIPEWESAGALGIVGDYIYSNEHIINTNLEYSSVIYNEEIGNPKKVITYGNYAYAAYSDGLKIFEVSDPTNPQLAYSMLVNNGVSDIHIDGNTLFMAPNDIGLRIYSLSNPAFPQIIVYKANVLGIKSIKTSGHYLITAGSHGIVVYSIYNLAAPVQTGCYYQEGDICWDLEVVGEQLFVCQGSYLGVYNIAAAVSNPDTPELPQPTVSISNYPNPFAGSTTIAIYGKVDYSPCELVIYNLKGQKVKSLHAGVMLGETQNLIWDGKDDLGMPVADGIYLYRFSQKGISQTKRMLRLGAW